MDKEEFVKQVKEIISSNDEFIEEVYDMVGSDYSRHKDRQSSLLYQNSLWKFALKLAERP